jgi:MoxR-like ATPase
MASTLPASTLQLIDDGPRPRTRPVRPTTLEETGLSAATIADLILKRLYIGGATTLTRLSKHTRLDYGIVEPLFRSLQKEQLCETKGMTGHDFEVSLTARGVRAAEDAHRRNQYDGPAPVPLKDYCSVVRWQSSRPAVNREKLSDCLSDLVVSNELIGELGTALTSGCPIFLYGPTGNGKTSVAERLHRLFTDCVYMPYAVDVSGYILAVYDPVLHGRASDPDDDTIDDRWVHAPRPAIRVGGELHSEMLEPLMDDVTRFYRAPLQMRANNGLLIIDDFGRQKMSSRDLLNRWILPLDRGIDQLSLTSGLAFAVPFDVRIVIATNLDPNELAEAAFMRRLNNKVKMDSVTPDVLRRILIRVCQEARLHCGADMQDYIISGCMRYAPDGQLSACYAGDIVRIVVSAAVFEQRAATVSKPDVDRALHLYFAH